MNDVAPLAYDKAPPRGDSVLGIIGLAVALLSAVVPLYMAWQIVTGKRRQFAVFKSYLRESIPVAGHPVSIYANWPWYAADCVALLLGLIGLYRGRPRFAALALAVAAASMIGKLTIVLGSPW